VRKFHLDELPQLINILHGDMTFVGPRPIPVWEAERAWCIPCHDLRTRVLPGLTGWAQIHQGYCATIEEMRERLCYDLFYLKHMSFSLDLWIFVRTVKILVLGRGAR